MGAVRRFSIGWAAWMLAIFLFAWIVSVAGGGPGGRVDIVLWVSGAMTLAAFPAGAMAARAAIAWDGPWLRALIAFGLATIAVGALVFALRGFVGPALRADVVDEPATWSLGDRIEALAIAEAMAEREGTLSAWQEANAIGWHVEVTLTSGLTAIAFAWIGALIAAWLPAGARPELRYAVLAGAGLFLLMTGYLMAENGYELLLLRTVGPAYVTAWFPLIAPGMAAVGLAIPTLARLLAGPGQDGSLLATEPPGT